MSLVATSYRLSSGSSAPQLPGTLYYDTNNVGANNVVTYYATNNYNSDSGPYAPLVLLTLDSAEYQLRKPICVGLKEKADDEYIATFAEAELSRSGDTPQEALAWLKSSIVELYELFKGEDQLGPLPQRQLRVLEQYIDKKPHRAR
jgi:hypothetical protein